MESMHYALTTVEGLHLTCDFVIYSAALFGCPPNYSPTRVGLHDSFREPYEIYGAIPFREYRRLAETSFMDEETLKALGGVTAQRMKDLTCIAWELDLSTIECFGKNEEINSSVLSRVTEAGEQILDIIRVFLFKPGEDASIGRVGSLGRGITGVWIGDGAGENGQFIARKTSKFQLVQEPVEKGLRDVRKIYNHDVFREMRSVVCSGSITDPTLALVLKSLRAFRESRDLPSQEARFLRLAAIAEHLARRTPGKRLAGETLREDIAKLACYGLTEKGETLKTVRDLWGNARNPLTHSADNFAAIGRRAESDIAAMEKLVFAMIEATVLDYRMEEFRHDPDAFAPSEHHEADMSVEPNDRRDPPESDDVPF